MAPTNSAHSRSHSLLLLQKLLNLREAASPLTLVLDSLEQPSKPLISELTTRAKISRTKVIFLSYTTIRKPQNVDVFIRAVGKDTQALQRELLSHYPALPAASSREKPVQRAVVIIDSVNNLATSIPQSLATFLSRIITTAVSIVATYHTDVPVILPKNFNEYEPHPYTILCHLATAILRLTNLHQEIERQKSRNRSLVEPEWGLKEYREGILIGQKHTGTDNKDDGVVISMELRRRSGRTVSEKFILLPQSNSPSSRVSASKTVLLSDYGIFASPAGPDEAVAEKEEPESTFNLGLTEKQRKDRDGIVLPYFDAQTDIGAGEGGRILYEMGREDDFDDEEDEI